ncbi:hypothetical protein [Puia dinghuensis]|uniref:Uncharacterized protein n=1 Tax=Puia dinghuensis TaxID=1792502 RepID=A0A8J2XU57_9BACT|nr:hypothetical protein [Puia dinghuensis]GGB08958.1 hypothetical protein GCM10011511_35610 [Puia dinghuensis]
MALTQPYEVLGYHSCDKKLALEVLTGTEKLKPSINPWDWLGEGIYFWEQNPVRSLEYGEENARGIQFNKKKIETPFVLGAIIELRRCLNLLESESLALLKKMYLEMEQSYKEVGKPLPVNKDSNRRLDCTVLSYMRTVGRGNPDLRFDTVRCAFGEGDPIYPGTAITDRNHIQICVLNYECIKGYFIPHPIERFNPYLYTAFRA